MNNIPKFKPSLMVQLHQINILIHNEKDETIKQDLLNQYNELVKQQCEIEERIYDFQYGKNYNLI